MKKLFTEWKALMKERDNRIVMRLMLAATVFILIYLAAIVYTCYVYLKGGPIVHIPKGDETLQIVVASAIAYRLHKKKMLPIKRLIFRH